VLLFITEVLIALYQHDNFIRSYGGDFLVVILVYCAVQTFWNISLGSACIGVLLFAYAVEISQYFHLVGRLGLERCRLAAVVLGTSFSWTDMLCYTAGMILVYVIEYLVHSNKAVIKAEV
jgi:hypothetical protein